jgi:predicted metalloprotease
LSSPDVKRREGRQAVTELVRRKRRLVLETPYRIRGRALIVHVEASGLRIREKGCRAGVLEITWAQVYNRAAEIAADRARQQAGEGKKGR